MGLPPAIAMPTEGTSHAQAQAVSTATGWDRGCGTAAGHGPSHAVPVATQHPPPPLCFARAEASPKLPLHVQCSIWKVRDTILISISALKHLPPAAAGNEEEKKHIIDKAFALS